MRSFLKKMDNNRGADLHMVTVMMILIFSLSIFMAMDFWVASSTKVILLKETEAAEIYSLVKAIEGSYDTLIHINPQEILSYNMTSYQTRAIQIYGQVGGSKDVKKSGEVYDRLNTINHLLTYKVTKVGEPGAPVGQIGIASTIEYTTKTIVRSPKALPGLFGNKIKATANKTISLSVSSKLVPVIYDR